MSLGGWAWAGLDNTNQAPEEIRLELNLLDGSRIIGVPSIESVPVQTSYAKMDVPLGQLINIKIGEDHETASLDLRNGDKLKGVINLEPISLETAFGRVSVGVEHIREIRVAMASTALPDALRQGLVLYYSFDRGNEGKVTDESGHGNHGKVIGAKWVSQGKESGAYDFRGGPDRGDSIFVPHSASLASMEKTQQLTLALWLKLRCIPIEFPDLICKGGNQPPDAFGGYELVLNGRRHSDIGFTGGVFDIHYGANGRMTHDHLNEWIHVAFVLNLPEKRAAFYVNGRDVGELHNSGGGAIAYPGFDFTKAHDLYLGAPNPSHHSNRAWYDGLMDEVMIFNRALAEQDVKQIYDAQKHPGPQID
jgi:hypothetical protein